MIPTTYVVPLDGSPFAERAISIAGALATRVGGRVLLVSAEHHAPLEPNTYLTEVAQRYPALPISTRAHVEHMPADAISKVVGESDDRMVVMTSHGRGRLRWAMLGSTAEDLVRRTDRPILLVGRHCRDDFLSPGARMLACVESMAASAAMAPAVLEWAARLELPLDAAIVVDPRDVESVEHPAPLIDPMVAAFGGPGRVTSHLLTSSYVSGALSDFADDLPAGLIAMSCHARTGLARVALGSVAMGVLNLAACPVLVSHCGV